MALDRASTRGPHPAAAEANPTLTNRVRHKMTYEHRPPVLAGYRIPEWIGHTTRRADDAAPSCFWRAPATWRGTVLRAHYRFRAMPEPLEEWLPTAIRGELLIDHGPDKCRSTINQTGAADLRSRDVWIRSQFSELGWPTMSLQPARASSSCRRLASPINST
jgi:hypothetical protein